MRRIPVDMSARVGGGVLTGCNSTDGHMHDQSGNLREFRIGQNITTVGDSPHSFPTPTNPKFCSSAGSSPPVTPVVAAPRECEQSCPSYEGRGKRLTRLLAVPTPNASSPCHTTPNIQPSIAASSRSSGSSGGLANCKSEPSRSDPCSQPSTDRKSVV